MKTKLTLNYNKVKIFKKLYNINLDINTNNGMFGAVLETSTTNNISNINSSTPFYLYNITSIENRKLQKCSFGVLVPLYGKINYLDENKNPLPNVLPGTIISYESGVTAEL